MVGAIIFVDASQISSSHGSSHPFCLGMAVTSRSNHYEAIDSEDNRYR